MSDACSLSDVCGRVGDFKGTEECDWWEQGRMLFVEIKRALIGGDVCGEFGDVFSASSVEMGRVCSRQRGYVAEDVKRVGKNPWGPKKGCKYS